MNRLMIVMCVVLVVEVSAFGQGVGKPAAALELVDATGVRAIDVEVSIDGKSFDAHWLATFDAIFAFADINGDGALKADEVSLVPSARAVRLSLGSAFAPPVSPVVSVATLTGRDAESCSREELRHYYLRNGVGELAIGCGRLSGTAAITEALVAALDKDRDRRVSRAEVQEAETALRRYDANDDELIGVGELVANATYPGTSATETLHSQSTYSLTGPGGDRVLRRVKAEPAEAEGAESTTTRSDVANRTVWSIRVTDEIEASPLAVAFSGRIESWAVPGIHGELQERLRAEVTSAEPEAVTGENGDQQQRRRESRDWLIALVDRNRDGKADSEEVEAWLTLQKQICRGQILLSVYSGGGLFELLDADHNAGLSVRELRDAWTTLESASSTMQEAVDVARIPEGLMLIVSPGYPEQLSRTAGVAAEWFQKMDRNADGDVSRREFTGSPAQFQRVDADGDGLISREEAWAAGRRRRNSWGGPKRPTQATRPFFSPAGRAHCWASQQWHPASRSAVSPGS